jgi:hypothetical protein
MNMKALCNFKFPGHIKRAFIEESIAQAIFNAECVFGKPRVRVSGVSYYISQEGMQCIIDVSSEVGEHVAQVFTGIMIDSLGEEKFQVRRIEGEPITAGAPEATEAGCEK